MHIKCFALRGKCGNEIVFKCTVSRQLLAYACSTYTHSPHCFQYPFLGNDVDNMFSDQGLFNLLIFFFSPSDHSQGLSQNHSFSSFSFTGFLDLFTIIISPHPSWTLKTQLKMRKLVL